VGGCALVSSLDMGREPQDLMGLRVFGLIVLTDELEPERDMARYDNYGTDLSGLEPNRAVSRVQRRCWARADFRDVPGLRLQELSKLLR
jgi:hypothetical protein